MIQTVSDCILSPHTPHIHLLRSVGRKYYITTHTDYVNRYPSSFRPLLTISLLRRNRRVVCCSCKGCESVPNNPTQHYGDIEMLSGLPELQPALTKSSGLPKRNERVRLDGANNEGPRHDEVRFWWIDIHL